MASIYVSRSAASSKLSGFKNEARTPLTGSVAVSSTSVGALSYTTHTFSISLPRAASLCSIRVRLTGLETFWRQVRGYTFKQESTYEIQVAVSRSGTTLNFTVYFVNETAGSISRPAFTAEAEVFTFVAPFS